MQTRRLTITVTEDLVEEAKTAVGDGRARSVSEWVAGAMAQRRARDRRLAALYELVQNYEAAHGAIAADEIAEQAQRDRDAAAVSRITARRAG
jgi:Arc/MetJ-type ribon-helix-helix transcriptional regulator